MLNLSAVWGDDESNDSRPGHDDGLVEQSRQHVFSEERMNSLNFGLPLRTTQATLRWSHRHVTKSLNTDTHATARLSECRIYCLACLSPWCIRINKTRTLDPVVYLHT